MEKTKQIIFSYGVDIDSGEKYLDNYLEISEETFDKIINAKNKENISSDIKEILYAIEMIERRSKIQNTNICHITVPIDVKRDIIEIFVKNTTFNELKKYKLNKKAKCKRSEKYLHKFKNK